MAKYLKPRRGSKESAYSQNIDLLKGEIFLEFPEGNTGKEPGRIVIGDGFTGYRDLDYATTSTEKFQPFITDPSIYIPRFENTIPTEDYNNTTAVIEEIGNGSTANTVVLPNAIGAIKKSLYKLLDNISNKLDKNGGEIDYIDSYSTQSHYHTTYNHQLHMDQSVSMGTTRLDSDSNSTYRYHASISPNGLLVEESGNDGNYNWNVDIRPQEISLGNLATDGSGNWAQSVIISNYGYGGSGLIEVRDSNLEMDGPKISITHDTIEKEYGWAGTDEKDLDMFLQRYKKYYTYQHEDQSISGATVIIDETSILVDHGTHPFIVFYNAGLKIISNPDHPGIGLGKIQINFKKSSELEWNYINPIYISGLEFDKDITRNGIASIDLSEYLDEEEESASFDLQFMIEVDSEYGNVGADIYGSSCSWAIIEI